MRNIPSTMRAWSFSVSGSPEKVLKFHEAEPTPPFPTTSDVIVKVYYAALSSAGINLMHNVPSILRHSAVPELDFSGFIEEAGSKAPSELIPGTAVFGTIPLLSSVLAGSGTLAEYVSVPAGNIVVKPNSVELPQAAGLTSLAHTAASMVEKAKIKEGDRVLVHGGGGDVGSMALQIAKAAGAVVVVTCSESKFDLAAQLGAEKSINYRASGILHEFLEKHYEKQKFDVILDTVGSQDIWEHCPKYLNPRGVYVNVGAVGISTSVSLWRWLRNSTRPVLLGGVPRNFIMFNTVPTKERGEHIAALAAERKLDIQVDSTFKIEDALLGYKRMGDGNRLGRCLIQIAQ